jgi:hypothetical protein
VLGVKVLVMCPMLERPSDTPMSAFLSAVCGVGHSQPGARVS